MVFPVLRVIREEWMARSTRWVGAGCCALAMICALALPSGAEGSPFFSRLSAEMNETRSGPVAASLPDGNVLIVGGYSGSEYLKSAEVFDPKTEIFEKLAGEMTEARYAPVVAALPDGDLLISGGENTWPFVRTAELFDPTTRTFEKLSAETVEEREGAVAMALPDGKVLIAGGYKPSGTVDTAELYNPTTKTFEGLPAVMTEPRFFPVAAVLPDGKLLIAGGVNSQSGVTSEPLSSAEVFNPQTEGFESLGAEMAEPREAATAASLPDGKVLIVGGSAERDHAGQTAEVFDPTTMTFEKLAAEIDGERSTSAAVSLPDGNVLIVGGDSTYGPPLRTAELASGSAALVPAFIWSGHSEALSESSFDWSHGTNWRGGAAPVIDEAIGTLIFPHLSNDACTSEPPTDTCYQALNNISGLSVESIKLDDADNYLLAGEGVMLGSGGLTATPGNSGSAGAFLEMPLQLTAPQRWSITSRGGEVEENGLAVGQGVTGSGQALGVELSKGPAFILASNMEVGPLAVNGANTNQAGIFNGVIDLDNGELNATNGQTVNLSHVFLVGTGAVGQLTTDVDELAIGTGGYPAKGIEAASVKLDSDSRIGFEISEAGGSARNGYSQLTSRGAIALEGAKFEVVVRPPKKGESCPVLTSGQTYMFVSTTGTLSGSFSNGPEGGPEISIRFAEACKQISQTMRISYHESGGTETVTGTVEAAVKEKQEEEAKERQEANERQGEVKREEAIKKLVEEHAKKVGEEAAVTEAGAARKRAEEEVVAATEKRQEEETATKKEQEEKAALGTGSVSLDGSTITDQSSGEATVKLTCTGIGACAGKVTLSGKSTSTKGKKAKTETIGTAAFSISPGKTATIKLTLNAAGKALLSADHGRLGATLSILKSSPAPSQTHTASVHLVRQKTHGETKK